MADIDVMKKNIFFDILEEAGRVFVLVRHSDAVTIGRRGFLSDEKKNGVVLVFNNDMDFRWEDGGIHAKLGFGTSIEKCFVPASEIMSVYSPEIGIQLNTFPTKEEKTDKADKSAKPNKLDKTEDRPAGSLIEVDFKKR